MPERERLHHRERVLYRQHTGPNPLNHQDDFSGPALRHGSLNSLFQVASYLSSSWKRGKARSRALNLPDARREGPLLGPFGFDSAQHRRTFRSFRSVNAPNTGEHVAHLFYWSSWRCIEHGPAAARGCKAFRSFRSRSFRMHPTQANTSPFRRKDPVKSPVSDLEDPALQCRKLAGRFSGPLGFDLSQNGPTTRHSVKRTAAKAFCFRIAFSSPVQRLVQRG